MQGLIPETVKPRTPCEQANALLGMTKNGANIFGAALGGVLVATAGPGWALGFDGATLLHRAAILPAMRIKAAARVETLERGGEEPARGLERVLLQDLALGQSSPRLRRWGTRSGMGAFAGARARS